jgi:broad specificity phosphatase PhoE
MPRRTEAENARMFLALHGQTEWNRDGRVQGRLDSPLTEHGRRQAVTAGRILGGQNLVPGTFEMVCSPLGRTCETARIIAAELGFDISAIRNEARLQEVSLGAWEGHTRAEVEARWPELSAGSNRYDWFFRSPDGETYDDVAARLRQWLEANAHRDRLIVVTHGIASRVLRGLYAGLAAEDALQLEVARDAVFRLADGQIAKLTIAADAVDGPASP